jgi:predicted phage gp36 major capsid-like protein
MRSPPALVAPPTGPLQNLDIDMHGYDEIVALSQASLNWLSHTAWENAQQTDILRHWSQKSLKASFKPMWIELLSDDSANAVITVDIDNGELALPK